MCCFRQGCHHPLCQQEKPDQVKWFCGGPDVDRVLLPVPDPTRPFGDPNCKTCKDSCSGHFLQPEQLITTPNLESIAPPSHTLKEFYLSLKGAEPTEDMLTALAQRTLLAVSEVTLWLDHLKSVEANRKRGATKAAATRKEKSTEREERRQLEIERQQVANVQETETREAGVMVQEYHCGVCSQLYNENTEEEELWIACDNCFVWYHAICVGVDYDNIPEQFFCPSCHK